MRTVDIFLLLFLATVISLEEGDDCNLPTGQKGTCVNIHDCAYARELLEKKEQPTLCGFEGNSPIVCCTQLKFRTIRYPGDISGQKCEEYYPYKGERYYTFLTGAAKPSLAKEFPHMAIIGFGDENDIQWLCGGSLISHNFVLTAAHCLRSAEFGQAKFVRVGDLDIASDTDEADPQDYNVKRVFPHPGYKKPSAYNDIGLIELDGKVKLTTYVAIACLDSHREHNVTTMIATGWGRTEFLGTPSSHLLKADFNVVPHDVCKAGYRGIDPSVLESGIVDDSQICAAGTSDQDTCQGDSGGPLQIINRDRTIVFLKVYDIVGVTSFGKACGLSKTPGVYTRVYNYLLWIESVVWPFS